MTRALERVVAATMCCGAVMLVASSVLSVVLLDSADTVLGWVNDPAWFPLATMAFAFAAVFPFVLVSLYAWNTKALGVLGLAGLATYLVGAVLRSGFEYDMAFVWPVLAEQAPALLDFDGPMFRDPRFGFVHLWMGLPSALGVLLFGAALFRARIFPRAACVLFVVGLLLAEGGMSPPFLIRALGGMMAGPAIAWMAWVVWNDWRDR